MSAPNSPDAELITFECPHCQEALTSPRGTSENPAPPVVCPVCEAVVAVPRRGASATANSSAAQAPAGDIDFEFEFQPPTADDVAQLLKAAEPPADDAVAAELIPEEEEVPPEESAGALNRPRFQMEEASRALEDDLFADMGKGSSVYEIRLPSDAELSPLQIDGLTEAASDAGTAATVCRVCDTRIIVPRSQLNTTITCPECFTKFLATERQSRPGASANNWGTADPQSPPAAQPDDLWKHLSNDEFDPGELGETLAPVDIPTQPVKGSANWQTAVANSASHELPEANVNSSAADDDEGELRLAPLEESPAPPAPRFNPHSLDPFADDSGLDEPELHEPELLEPELDEDPLELQPAADKEPWRSAPGDLLNSSNQGQSDSTSAAPRSSAAHSPANSAAQKTSGPSSGKVPATPHNKVSQPSTKAKTNGANQGETAKPREAAPKSTSPQTGYQAAVVDYVSPEERERRENPHGMQLECLGVWGGDDGQTLRWLKMLLSDYGAMVRVGLGVLLLSAAYWMGSGVFQALSDQELTGAGKGLRVFGYGLPALFLGLPAIGYLLAIGGGLLEAGGNKQPVVTDWDEWTLAEGINKFLLAAFALWLASLPGLAIGLLASLYLQHFLPAVIAATVSGMLISPLLYIGVVGSGSPFQVWTRQTGKLFQGGKLDGFRHLPISVQACGLFVLGSLMMFSSNILASILSATFQAVSWVVFASFSGLFAGLANRPANPGPKS